MLYPTKSRFNRTKRFVVEHRTAVACVLTGTTTAVTATYFTRKFDIHMMNTMLEVLTTVQARIHMEDTSQLRAAATDAFEFIESKDMMEEFIKNAPRLEV